MWLFANGKIHMGEMWRIFAVILGLLAPQLNATSSISHNFSTASSSIVSNVLPSISASDLSSTIQNVTASTDGGISMTKISSTFAINATAPVQVSSSSPLGAQPSINSSLETKTSVLFVSETRTLYHSTTVALGGSQNVSASQASTGGVISTIHSSYYLNSSAVTSSASSVLLNPKQSSSVVSEIGTSNVLFPSSVSEGKQSTASSLLLLGSSMSVNTTSLTSVVSSAVSPSSYVSATRTLPLTQSSVAVTDATSTQSLMSHSMTLNDTVSYGSSTGLSSQSMAVTSLLGLGTSHTVFSSVIAMATNGTLLTHSTSSISNNASNTEVKSPFTTRLSATILASTTAKSALGSSNGTVATATMSETMVAMVNSSAQLVHLTMTTTPTSKAVVSPTAFLSVIQSTSSMSNSTLQPFAVLSSVRLVVNQTSAIVSSSTLSPSGQVPRHNQTVTAILTSTTLPSTNVAALSSSPEIGLGSSTANATVERSSSLQRSVALSTTTSQPSSSILFNTSSKAVEPSSAVDVGVVSSTAAANETSRPFSVLPSLVVSQNATSQSAKTSSLSSSMSGGLTLLSTTTTPSPSLPVTPNKTSTDDGFIVISSSYSCYIYYVVEKTVFPMTTANQSIVVATIPKVTIDIGSATSMRSELPTVTLTHPVTMATQVSKVHSQAVVTSSAPDSIRSVEVPSGSIVPTMVSLKSSVESMLTPSQPPILTSATVTMGPSVSIASLTDTRSGTVSTSKKATLSPHLQPESSQQQSVTLSIPFVTPSVGDLSSSAMANRSLGSSPAILPSRFSPIVATPSVSDKPIVSTSTSIGTEQKSVHSSHGGSSVTSTSSVQSRSPVNIVTPSVPSQSLNVVSPFSGASHMMSNSSTSVIQVSEGALLPSSTIPSGTPKTSIPSIATLLTTQAGTSSSKSHLIAATSTASVTQSRNTSVTSSSHVLVTNTTGLSSNSPATVSQVPTSSSTSESVKTSAIVGSTEPSQISSSAFVGSSKMSHVNSSTTVITSVVEATKSSSSSIAMVLSTGIQISPNTSTRIAGQFSSVMPSSSGSGSQVGSINTAVVSISQVNTGTVLSQVVAASFLLSTSHQTAATSLLLHANNQSASIVVVVPSSSGIQVSSTTVSSFGGQLPSVLPSSSGTISQNSSPSTPVSSSPQMALSSSLYHAGNTTSAVNSKPSSAMPVSSLTSGSKHRRKKRAVGDNSISVTVQLSSTIVTAPVAEAVASTGLSSSSESTLIPPTSSVVSQNNSVIQTAVGGSSHDLSPTSLLSSSGQPHSISQFLSSQSTSTSLISSQQVATSSQLQGNLTQTAVLSSSPGSTSSASGQFLTVSATSGSSSMLMTTGSASSSVQSSSPTRVSRTTSTAQIPFSVPISAGVAPSGTLIQSHGLVSSFHSAASSVKQSSDTVSASSSETRVVATLELLSTSKPVFNGSSVTSSMQSSLSTSWPLGGQSSSLGAIVSSTFYNNGTVPSLSSVDVMTSSAALSNRNSTSVLIASSTATHSVKSLSSHELTLSAAVNTPSKVVVNGSLPSTTSMALIASSAVLGNSTLSSVSLSSKHASLTNTEISSTVAANRTSISSLIVIRSSMFLGNGTATVATDMKQPSTVFTNASVTASSSSLVQETRFTFEVIVPSASSASLGRSSSSLTQQAHDSTVLIAASPLPTKVGNVTSSTASSFPFANKSVVSTTKLLTDHASQTLIQTFSSPHAVQPSPSTLQSGIQHTITNASLSIISSSNVYKPPLVTMSSLGICYVVYTTRIVPPTLVPTPQVNLSSTASVNASSTLDVSVFTSVLNTTSIQVLPTVSLNTSSVMLPPTLTVNVSSVQSSIINATAKPNESSFIDVVLSTVPAINSSVLFPATKSSQEAKRSVVSQTKTITASSLPIFTTVLSRIPATSVIEVSSFVQAVTSKAVLPTRTITEAVSSSVTVPTAKPPDQSLLMETIIIVDLNTDIESPEFQSSLKSDLEAAYSFSLLQRRRRRKASGTVAATIQSIQRVHNGNKVNVTFFITQDGQHIPASQAAQNYNRLSKNQFAHFIKLDVIIMPQPLMKPSTSPAPLHRLVSLIILDSAGNNISIPANKAKLESNLASYYKDKKQLQASTTVTATIQTIQHEPNERAYLEFYISVDGAEVNRTVVVETFKVSNVNLLTAQLGFQVLIPVYVPDSLSASESDHVIIGLNVNQKQDLNSSSFRSELATKLVALYVEAKVRKNSRRKRRSGSTSATILDIVRNANSTPPEADVTFFMLDSGVVVNGSYVASVMNRLSTGQMTTFTMPYAVLSAPRAAFVPTTPPEVPPTEVPPTVAATPIKWWIIPAVICPILLIIVIILLVYWRWKKGAPKAKVEPDTIRMLESNTRRTPPVHGFDVARYTKPGVSGMKTTSFTSGPSREEVEETEKPARRGRETSLRRKVGKPPVQKLPTRQIKLTNPAYEEDEGGDESVASETPPGSMVGLIREKRRQPPSATKKTAGPPQRHQEPQRQQEPQKHQELSDDESEEESEVSGEETESEPESVVPPAPQTKHSAAQVPTVAVMGEASGPPRYPPVRFRSSVHPAPSLPPLNAKQTSLVGVKVEPPSDDDARRGRKKGKVTKRELEQRADLERQKNKQRLRDRKRDSARPSIPPERRAWDRAQHDFDDVLADEEVAEGVITGKREKRRKRRPPSSSVATDEEGTAHLKSYRKLKSPKTTASSTTSTRDHGKKHRKSEESVSNASSDESEIDMNETRRRMHAMLDDAFSLFGPHSSMKHPSMEPEGQSPRPEGYPAPPARAVVPRYIGGHPALPEPPPAHGRATEPTPGQRRRVQPTMPGYPAAMPQTPIGVPGYPGRPPVRPVVTRDPLVVWDPADRQRILNQQAPPPTFAYRDPSGQNVYITPVHQQRGDMGGLVWSPYAAEDSMDALYPDLAQASYPGALGTSPPKDTSYLSHIQTAQPHDTILGMSPSSTLDQREATLGQSPQPLIKSIKGELFRLSQGATRKTPITEL